MLVRPGDWVQPVMRGYHLICCGCGLTHRMNFRIHTDSRGKQHVLMQAFRMRPIKTRQYPRRPKVHTAAK